MANDAPPDLISDAMRGILGKIQRRRTSYPVSASDIRKWAIAVYYPGEPPERFMGVGAAGGEAPLVAPEEFNPFAWCTQADTANDTDLTAGYLEERAGIPPPPVQFMAHGGGDCEYGAPIVEGDVITAQFSIENYSQRQGKRGPLLFTDGLDRWTNQRGELVCDFKITLVRY